MKFADQMFEIQKQLEASGHQVLMPIKAPGVDYWAEGNERRVRAKQN